MKRRFRSCTLRVRRSVPRARNRYSRNRKNRPQRHYNQDMSRTTVWELGWVLVLNGVAVLVLGSEAQDAFHAHAFVWATGFALVASAYLLGLFVQIGQFRLAGSINGRLRAGGVYLFAALTTALTVTDLMYEADAVGRPFSGWPGAACNASLTGSLLLAVSFLTVLIKPGYGWAVALVGTCLSWPYFALLAWNLPWRDFVWLV